jgi:hypothetical protein
MGDAGEGLVDAESRLAERMEEREQERRQARVGAPKVDPERVRQVESLRLATSAAERQLEVATHDVRKHQLRQSVADIEKRLKALANSRT